MGWRDGAKKVETPPAGWKATARKVEPAETVQPAPEPSKKPGVLTRSLQLGGVYPAAGLASLASPLFDLAGMPGYGETFDDMRDGVESGYTLGFNDELAGAAGMTVGKDYATVRDAKRAEDRAAQVRSGKAYFLGSLTGGAAVPFPGGSGANAGRMALVKTLGQGALGGVGMSEADTVGGEIVDGLKGAGVGLVTHGALQGGGQLLKRGQPVLRRVMDKIAVAQGRRALLNGADSLSSRKLVGEDAVREAIDSNAIVPAGTVEGTFNRLDRLTEAQGEGLGAVIETLEQKGVQGLNANDLAAKMRARAAQIRPGEVNDAIPGEFERQAAILESRRPTVEVPPTEYEAGYTGRSPVLPLSQGERLKRALQREAHYDRLNLNPLDEAKQEIASMYRQANEDAIEAAARANPGSEIEHLAEGFVPIKQRYGNLNEARGAAARGAQRAGQRGSVPLEGRIAALMAPDATTGFVRGMLSKVWKDRGPSTVAWAARNLGESRAVGDGLRAAPLWLGRSSGAITNTERDALIEWLREKKAAGQE